MERLRRIARRVTNEELIERGFAALEATGLDRDQIESIARAFFLIGEYLMPFLPVTGRHGI